jgi:hypothetical protein
MLMSTESTIRMLNSRDSFRDSRPSSRRLKTRLLMAEEERRKPKEN